MCSIWHRAMLRLAAAVHTKVRGFSFRIRCLQVPSTNSGVSERPLLPLTMVASSPVIPRISKTPTTPSAIPLLPPHLHFLHGSSERGPVCGSACCHMMCDQVRPRCLSASSDLNGNIGKAACPCDALQTGPLRAQIGGLGDGSSSQLSGYITTKLAKKRRFFQLKGVGTRP
jgi:hypothetical protein